MQAESASDAAPVAATPRKRRRETCSIISKIWLQCGSWRATQDHPAGSAGSTANRRHGLTQAAQTGKVSLAFVWTSGVLVALEPQEPCSQEAVIRPSSEGRTSASRTGCLVAVDRRAMGHLVARDRDRPQGRGLPRGYGERPTDGQAGGVAGGTLRQDSNLRPAPYEGAALPG